MSEEIDADKDHLLINATMRMNKSIEQNLKKLTKQFFGIQRNERRHNNGKVAGVFKRLTNHENTRSDRI